MRWVFPIVAALLCSFVSEELLAQGLLGRASISGQYLRTDFSDHDIVDFKGTGNGARAMFNYPIIPREMQECSHFGADFFLTGFGFALSEKVGKPNARNDYRLENYGIETGVNLFGCLTDSLKPFVQIGVQTSRSKLDLFDGNFTIGTTESDTGLIYGGGVEWCILPMVAWQTSVFAGSRFTGAFPGSDLKGKTELRNELILHTSEHLFFRLSLIANFDSDFIGGFGGGFSW